MPRWLWPPRTGQTFVDRWTLVHMAFFFVLGADWVGTGIPESLGGWSIPVAACAAVSIGLLWECIERPLERWNLVKHPESKFNAWVSDPIMDTLGFFIGYWWVLGQ